MHASALGRVSRRGGGGCLFSQRAASDRRKRHRFAAIDMRTTTFLLHAVKRIFPTFEFTWLGEEMEQNLPLEMDFRASRHQAIPAFSFDGAADLCPPRRHDRARGRKRRAVRAGFCRLEKDDARPARRPLGQEARHGHGV